jgi:subtilase family serine protease
MSFGGSEEADEPSLDNILTTPAGHIGGSGLSGGITFVASTGDNSAPAGYPAYSPNVVAVGGTSLYLDDQGNYLGENGWGGSGGGISQIEPEPAYQYSVQDTGARTCPDVSYDADPNTGFYVYNTVGSSGWTVIGGTSAGAPQWAALIALADQGRADIAGAGSLDGATQTLPALYSPQMSGDFFDITAGFNGYNAGPGYDLVTGLGSPYAPYVVTDLAFVDVAHTAAAGMSKKSSSASLADGAALLNASNQLPTMQIDKNTVDLVLAEPSMLGATTAGLDLAPRSSVLANRPALHLVADTGLTHFHHFWTPDLGFDISDAGMQSGSCLQPVHNGLA